MSITARSSQIATLLAMGKLGYLGLIPLSEAIIVIVPFKPILSPRQFELRILQHRASALDAAVWRASVNRTAS